MARPSKLDEKLIEDLYQEIKQGLPVTYACDLFSITQPSYNNWMRQGEQDLNDGLDTLFSTFFLTIKKAQSEYVREAIQDIKSGRPGWQGAAWCLERTRRDFQPSQQIDAGPDGKVTVVLGGKIKDIKSNGNAE